jgi:FkbM family methyltransferase
MLLNYVKRKLRKMVTSVYDPLVKINIGSQIIKINLSHQLSEYLKLYPDYNFNLGRIVKYAEEEIPGLSVIDIGANVGDTVAFIRNYSNVPILCIDGEENYVNILRENTKQYENIQISHSMVGKENKEEQIRLRSQQGTAYVEKGEKSIQVRTLENILEEFPAYKNSRILKSDTDGYDTWILRSCEAYLLHTRPILFFEFDPYLITKNNDDPFDFIQYLRNIGYKFLVFYTNTGDYLLGCRIDEIEIIDQIIHYFSGRSMETFLDICAFGEEDERLFHKCVSNELAHFKKERNY